MRSILLSAALVLAGCASPPGAPVSQGDTAFEGIAQLLESRRSVDVLLTHGMCTRNLEGLPDTDWGARSLQRLRLAFGGASDSGGSIERLPLEGTPVQVHRLKMDLPAGTLRASAIVWSPLTQPLKTQLCYDQSNSSALCQQAQLPAAGGVRATVNGQTKDVLLDDCLADAVIFAGAAREPMIAHMRAAVLRALDPADAGPHWSKRTGRAFAVASVPVDTPLVFVTESLGSNLMFEALLSLRDPRLGTVAAAERTRARTTQVFMQANQMPLLALAAQSMAGPQDQAELPRTSRSTAAAPLAVLPAMSPLNPLARFLLPRVGDPDLRRRPARVIAFGDPNDLLSYRLGGSMLEQGLDVVDQPASNATPWFGVLANPVRAHQGYPENAAVRRMIVCGKASAAPCPQWVPQL